MKLNLSGHNYLIIFQTYFIFTAVLSIMIVKEKEPKLSNLYSNYPIVVIAFSVWNFCVNARTIMEHR